MQARMSLSFDREVRSDPASVQISATIEDIQERRHHIGIKLSGRSIA